jgi:cyclic-di-GMP phosphodiesterase, flagellum assembly factor TipF
VEAAAAFRAEIVATDVVSDDEAVRLIEIGIDLMAGERFAAPRRLAAGTDGPSDRVHSASGPPN